mmetsp:Transcript_40048/g.113258  ORF Transcript_40048/g.113258 Transcript_40048/m.113258 type:complete len:492 (+) Transcript_40048:1370-2845(+)
MAPLRRPRVPGQPEDRQRHRLPREEQRHPLRAGRGGQRYRLGGAALPRRAAGAQHRADAVPPAAFRHPRRVHFGRGQGPRAEALRDNAGDRNLLHQHHPPAGPEGAPRADADAHGQAGAGRKGLGADRPAREAVADKAQARQHGGGAPRARGLHGDAEERRRPRDRGHRPRAPGAPLRGVRGGRRGGEGSFDAVRCLRSVALEPGTLRRCDEAGPQDAPGEAQRPPEERPPRRHPPRQGQPHVDAGGRAAEHAPVRHHRRQAPAVLRAGRERRRDLRQQRPRAVVHPGGEQPLPGPLARRECQAPGADDGARHLHEGDEPPGPRDPPGGEPHAAPGGDAEPVQHGLRAGDQHLDRHGPGAVHRADLVAGRGLLDAGDHGHELRHLPGRPAHRAGLHEDPVHGVHAGEPLPGPAHAPEGHRGAGRLQRGGRRGAAHCRAALRGCDRLPGEDPRFVQPVQLCRDVLYGLRAPAHLGAPAGVQEVHLVEQPREH